MTRIYLASGKVKVLAGDLLVDFNNVITCCLEMCCRIVTFRHKDLNLTNKKS